MKQEDTLRMPPQNLDAEQSVLGGVLIDPSALVRIADTVRASDFYREGHRRIYEAMLALDTKHEPIDFITLSEALKSSGSLDDAGGIAYLTTLVDNVPTAVNIKHYARIVREKANLRRVIAACQEAAADSYDAKAAPHEIILKLSSTIVGIETGRDGTVHIGEPATHELKRIEHKYDDQTYFPGYHTGFEILDKEMGGIQKQNLIVVAGRPSVGKTALLVNFVYELCRQTGILFFSLDQSKDEFARRLISRYSMVNNYAIRDGQVAPKEWPKIIDATATLCEEKSVPLYINSDSGIRLPEIVHLTKKYVMEKKVGILMIDYLQLIKRPHRDSENEEIGEITATLKDLSKELDIPVILLSQLNRALEKRPDNRPIMADLRGSGSIEQDAHIIVFLHWDEEWRDPVTTKRGRLEFIVGKNKDGRRGKIYLDFNKPVYWMKETAGEFK